jgi:CBS domain containing-hemolysin-like protein
VGPAEIAIIITLVGLLVASGFCSASETTLFSLSHADRQLLASKSPATSRILERLLANPSGLLITILLLNVTVNTTAFVLATLLGAKFSPTIAGIIGFVVLTATILAGEVIPKTLAVSQRVRFTPIVVPVIVLAGRILYPIRIIAERFIIRPLARVVAPARPPISDAEALAELKQLLESQSASGIIQPQERRMLSDVLRLRTLRVLDVMTPRREIVWLNESDHAATLLETCKAYGHSRYPLLAADERTVVGVVRAQDVLPAIGASRQPKSVLVRVASTPVHFVPERARLDQLLERFRTARAELAMCVNELGEVTGMVQIEDVVRELGIGPADADAPERQIRMVAMNTWELPGRLSLRHLDEFLAHLEMRIADDDRPDVDTLAGLVADKLGRMPRLGDAAEFDGFRLLVQSLSGRSVLRVWFVLVPKAAAGDDAATIQSRDPSRDPSRDSGPMPDGGGAL